MVSKTVLRFGDLLGPTELSQAVIFTFKVSHSERKQDKITKKKCTQGKVGAGLGVEPLAGSSQWSVDSSDLPPHTECGQQGAPPALGSRAFRRCN